MKTLTNVAIDDFNEDAEVAGPVHAGGLIEIFRDRVEIALHQIGIHRDHPCHVDQHQREVAIDQSQQLGEHENGNQRGKLRDHLQQ